MVAPDDLKALSSKCDVRNIKSNERMAHKCTVADYDQICPLFNGYVMLNGFDLEITTNDIRKFCVDPACKSFSSAPVPTTSDPTFRH